MRSFWNLSGIFLVAVVTLACGAGEAVVGADPAEERLVERGELARRLLLTGELAAEESQVLIAPNANIWPLQIRWMAEDGVRVAAGERVVEFDNSSLTAQLEDARLRVTESENALASKRAEVEGRLGEKRFAVEKMEGTLEKMRLAAEVPEELRSPRQYQEDQLALERSRLELENARRALEAEQAAGRAEIALAELDLEKARREVEKSEEAIAKLELRAPKAGILLVAEMEDEGRPYQNGDNIRPGQVVAEIPDLSTLVVEADLFDVDDGRLAPGMPVVAAVDAFPDRVFEGRVREVGNAAEGAVPLSSRRVFPVIVELEALDALRLRPGMSVRVEVELDRRQDVVLVPRASLSWDDGGRASLHLASGGSREVELGPCSALVCELADGPEVGTRLAEAPP